MKKVEKQRKLEKFQNQFSNQSLYEGLQGKKTPKRYEVFTSSFALITKDGEPSCYQEAVDDVDSKIWKKAMEEEMESLAKKIPGIL